MLSKYGTDNIIVMLSVGAILILLGFFIAKPLISYPIGFLGILLVLFTLWFFRDPERTINPASLNNDSVIISPADGLVLDIIDVYEKHYLNANVKQISIFLSPLDVHVNRSPLNGIVKYFKYTPGQYIIANHPKSSELNEQTHIGVENSCGKILFKQIVGVVARRLVWDIKEGDSLKAGQRFGMMKFGSRMDILLDPNSNIIVKRGDKVKAGVSLIAYLPKK
jgi:phosphatidylserine decarboxylase